MKQGEIVQGEMLPSDESRLQRKQDGFLTERDCEAILEHVIEHSARPGDRFTLTCILTRSSQASVPCVKTIVHRIRERFETGGSPEKLIEATQKTREWPVYAISEFHEVVENAEALQRVVGNTDQVLFHAMELETLLSRVEQKGRDTERKYESRLAASLRDIFRVHEPCEFTKEQADCLKGSITALVEGWGRLTREKLRYVRTRLLDLGLTWLPVTEKAVHDTEETTQAK